MDDLSAGIALGGPDVLATIKNAQTVTAQRVDSIPADERQSGDQHPQLKILGTPFPVSPEEASLLKNIFSKGATYLSPSKSCEFRANVRYGFVSSTDKVELVLCFGCGELEVWRGEHLVSFGPFDGAYGGLLGLTRKLFPNDRFFDNFSEERFKERAARMKVEKPTKP